MKIPVYVEPSEVKRVCKELGLRDWGKIKKPVIKMGEAVKILRGLDTGGMKIDPEQFRIGLEVELEHGTMFPLFNVTNNHPILTGKIVLAHFMEMLDYYQRLDVAEKEGDLLKALKAKDLHKARKYYRGIAEAKQRLAKTESATLK